MTGIAGARPGFLRGSLAGLAAVESLGLSSRNAAARRRKLHHDLRRAQIFAERLVELFSPMPELRSLVKDDTVVCRCEEVSWQDVQAAWKDGADSTYSVKLWTRAGMGRCQGRICGDAIAALLADHFAVEESQLRFIHPRLPIRPIPLDLASEVLSKI